jgi:hypothetical protein
LLAPWLIYFLILSLTLLFESWTYFIIGWVPFYSWFRLFFLLYLVLPQTQGAKILYLNYLDPFVVGHERELDRVVEETHRWLESFGIGYFNFVVEWLRDRILGQKNPQAGTQQAGPEQAGGYASYAQDLLARFAMPAARDSSGAGIYGTLSGLASTYAASTGGRRDLVGDAAGIPDSLVRDISLRDMSTNDRGKALDREHERLTQMLKALEAEKQSHDLAYGSAPGARSVSGGLKTKSCSEQSFENLSHDDAEGHRPAADRRTSGGWAAGVQGWFGGEGDKKEKGGSKGWSAAKDITDAMTEGLSSGFDRGR